MCQDRCILSKRTANANVCCSSLEDVNDLRMELLSAFDSIDPLIKRHIKKKVLCNMDENKTGMFEREKKNKHPNIRNFAFAVYSLIYTHLYKVPARGSDSSNTRQLIHGKFTYHGHKSHARKKKIVEDAIR